MPLDRCRPCECLVNTSLLAFCTRVLYMSSLLLMLNNAGLAIVWDMLFHPDIYAERREKSSRRRGECWDLTNPYLCKEWV